MISQGGRAIADVPMRPKEIPLTIESLKSHLQETAHGLQELLERISPCLRQEDNKQAQPTAAPCSTLVGSDLASILSLIDGMGVVIRDALDRLEL